MMEKIKHLLNGFKDITHTKRLWRYCYRI